MIYEHGRLKSSRSLHFERWGGYHQLWSWILQRVKKSYASTYLTKKHRAVRNLKKLRIYIHEDHLYEPTYGLWQRRMVFISKIKFFLRLIELVFEDENRSSLPQWKVQILKSLFPPPASLLITTDKRDIRESVQPNAWMSSWWNQTWLWGMIYYLIFFPTYLQEFLCRFKFGFILSKCVSL